MPSNAHPAPSRAPTTALPPEIERLLDHFEGAVMTYADVSSDGRGAVREQNRIAEARAALDAALLQFVEDGRRLDWLDERGVRSIIFADEAQLNTGCMRVRDVLDDGRHVLESIDAAPSVVSAPVGEAEQP